MNVGDHALIRDESRGDGLKQGVSKWFVLAAVGIRDSSRQPIAEAMFALKKRHFGAEIEGKEWAASEIKGRFVARSARRVAAGSSLERPKSYSVLKTAAQVDGLISDLGLVFAKFRPIVFAICIDKVKLLRKQRERAYPPLGAAYAYLSQRVALTVERVHPGEGAILVADQQTQHEKFFRSGEMNRVREEMTSKLKTHLNFDLVLDKPLWIDTDLSSWDREILQLADIVAYASNEWATRERPPGDPFFMWNSIRPHFAINWMTGSIESGGLSVFPKAESFPETQ